MKLLKKHFLPACAATLLCVSGLQAQNKLVFAEEDTRSVPKPAAPEPEKKDKRSRFFASATGGYSWVTATANEGINEDNVSINGVRKRASGFGVNVAVGSRVWESTNYGYHEIELEAGQSKYKWRGIEDLNGYAQRPLLLTYRFVFDSPDFAWNWQLGASVGVVEERFTVRSFYTYEGQTYDHSWSVKELCWNYGAHMNFVRKFSKAFSAGCGFRVLYGGSHIHEALNKSQSAVTVFTLTYIIRYNF